MKQVAHIYHRRYAVLHVFYDVKNRLNISPFLEEKIRRIYERIVFEKIVRVAGFDDPLLLFSLVIF